MIHPYARAVALVGSIAAAVVTADWSHLAVLWLAVIMVGAIGGLLRETLLFHMMGVMPIAIGMTVIKAAEVGFQSGSWTNILLTNPKSVFLDAGRFAITGLAIQAATLPLLKRGLLQDALWRLRVRGNALALVSAAVNAIADITKFAHVTLDALKARGLVSGPFSRFRELHRLLASVFTHALRAGILREETWVHRSISPDSAVGVDPRAWRLAQSWVFAIGVVLALFSYAFWIVQ